MTPTRVRTRRTMGRVPAGTEGRVGPTEGGTVRVYFGELGELRWDGDKGAGLSVKGRNRSAIDAMLVDCEGLTT